MAELDGVSGIYREARPAADLAGHVQCTWHRHVGQAEAANPVPVVPDGCIDLLWLQGEFLVAGPDTTTWVRSMPVGTEVFGLRFWPGTAPSVLGLPASEVVNGRIPASIVSTGWAAEIADRLGAAHSHEHVNVLQEAVRGRLKDAPTPDPLVRHVVRTITNSYPSDVVRVDRLADQAGISERQLHRRCCVALGYGAKTFARIVRFQRFLASARAAAPDTLAAIAAETGYADQAHLARDVRLLTGLSPTKLVAEGLT